MLECPSKFAFRIEYGGHTRARSQSKRTCAIAMPLLRVLRRAEMAEIFCAPNAHTGKRTHVDHYANALRMLNRTTSNDIVGPHQIERFTIRRAEHTHTHIPALCLYRELRVSTGESANPSANPTKSLQLYIFCLALLFPARLSHFSPARSLDWKIEMFRFPIGEAPRQLNDDDYASIALRPLRR